MNAILFRKETVIRFLLSSSALVSVDLEDLQGRRVAKILEKLNLKAGTHSLTLSLSKIPKGPYRAIITKEHPRSTQVECLSVHLE